jgi:hypothetical protein
MTVALPHPGLLHGPGRQRLPGGAQPFAFGEDLHQFRGLITRQVLGLQLVHRLSQDGDSGGQIERFFLAGHC